MIQQSARWLAQGNEESQVSKGAAQILDLEPKKKINFQLIVVADTVLDTRVNAYMCTLLAIPRAISSANNGILNEQTQSG